MAYLKASEWGGHAGAVYACCVRDHLVYTGSADHFVARWRIAEGTQDTFSIRMEQTVYALCAVGGVLWIGRADGGIHLVDLEKRLELHYFTQHVKAVFSIAHNTIQHQVYAGDADGNLSVWDAEKAQLLLYLPLDCGKIRDIAVHPNGHQIAVAGQDGFIRIFDTVHFNETHSIQAHTGWVTSVLFSTIAPDILISGGKDAHLRSWNLNEGSLERAVPAHNYAVYALIAVNNGMELVSASRDKTIKIWTHTLDFIERLDHKAGGHRHSVNALAKLDEEQFISVSDDKRIIRWKKA